MLVKMKKRSLSLGFYQILQISKELGAKAKKIERETEFKVKAKLFYKWFDKYYELSQKMNRTYYFKCLKRKVWTILNLNRRKTLLKLCKA